MGPINSANTTVPALSGELEALKRQLKVPQARALIPELIASAHAERGEPVKVITDLFVEEAVGRVRSMLVTRRKEADFLKPLDAWDPAASSVPRPDPAGPCAPWNGSAAGKTSFRLAHLCDLIRTLGTDDSVPRAVTRILRSELVVMDNVGLLPVATATVDRLLHHAHACQTSGDSIRLT
ncbi:ATP-binding protein [Arthrobacter mobilis]|uniref:ATP-binding protein n=1 Tax=Arthrobacter mobilis TaxID=2724944 RepID=A0A7X6HDY3_9MICC|nr:ATP-binding protein [Arthrobacter mobilis]NKX55354.1 ATP-binding protein [Arthrobacter mobilis]